MDGTRDEATRDETMPYGVDTIRLRISFPAVPASRGYNGRAWGMRPLRGWTGRARWDEEAAAAAAAAAAQDSARSSLQATLDRVIAAMPTEPPAVEAQGGVQYAQRGPSTRNPTPRAEPNSEGRSLPEVGRVGRFSNLRSQLQEIDPGNPLLQTLADPRSYVPTEADIEALGRALDDAHSRRPPLQGPVSTFDNPDQLEIDETGPQKRQHASDIWDHQIPVALQSLTLASTARSGDPYVGTVAVRDGTRALFSLQAVANQRGANVQPAAVIFGHGDRHIDPLVAPDLRDAIISPLPGTLPFGIQGQGRIIFGGTPYLFRYYGLGNGDVRVGTHFPE